MSAPLDLSAEYGTRRFAAVLERDRAAHVTDDALVRWLLVEPGDGGQPTDEPGVLAYTGPQQLLSWFGWAAPFAFPDWFVDDDDPLLRASAGRDAACLARLGVEHDDVDLSHLARYNVQDHRLARFYPVPQRQRPRVVLDLGAGHGRLANLATRPGEDLDLLVAVDGIAGPYLTQRAYYAGLGLTVADYLDSDEPDRFDVAALAHDNDVVHLPTWRLDLVPDASVDLVCAVQVLRELPRPLVWFVLGHLARVLRPGGALYLRDHHQGHDLNQLPIDELVGRHGFTLEFAPYVRDREEVHGLPRVWRRLDPATHDAPTPR